MLLKTIKTRTQCTACERTFSSDMRGVCHNPPQFCPFLRGNRVVLAGRPAIVQCPTLRGDICSNRARASRVRRRTQWQAARQFIPRANPRLKIQDSRKSQIGNHEQQSKIETRKWNCETINHHQIVNLQFPIGASWSTLDRIEFQATRATGNAPLAGAQRVNPGLEATMFMIIQPLRRNSGILSEFVCY